MKTSEETHWQRFKRKSKSPKEWLKKVYEFFINEHVWDAIFKVFLKLVWAVKDMGKSLKRVIENIFN
ncbi:hypothetical protein JI729_04435 [Bacillus sp. TK-2]|uniref:hypothetical protein n=1 Tax=Bacillus cereus group TaxID=86661 RepID=UPI00032DBD3B|nr:MULTISPECIES: hypothetical protein [Bacillus cereus group]QQP80594.1 hypothetical protein JI729_04435 [Bacillus sp. TK-2]EOQ01668.1 hypothetical protein IIY_02057 [Bacillus cereus VD140]MBE4941239.1 hypothetical protein [Bacillus thuringiensis]MDF9535597.1 hypothetical protein [Bacillus cereus]MEB8802603.1 hypothetical protein [Bacillus cereus]